MTNSLLDFSTGFLALIDKNMHLYNAFEIISGITFGFKFISYDNTSIDDCVYKDRYIEDHFHYPPSNW